MPITQDRMITMVKCARACYELYRTILESIDDRVSACEAGKPFDTSLYELQSIARRSIADYTPHLMALAAEESHFRSSTIHENARRAKYMAKRRAEGYTAPNRGPKSPKAPKPPKDTTQITAIDEEPEITGDDIMGMVATPKAPGPGAGAIPTSPAPIPNPGFAPPTREELAAQLMADAQLAQDLLRDETFRAITINPKGVEPKSKP